MLETVTMGGIVFGLIVLVALFVAAMIAWPKRRGADATAPGNREGSDVALYVPPWGSTPAAQVDAGDGAGAAADPGLAAFDGGSSGGAGGGASFDGGGSDGGSSAGGGPNGGGGGSD